MQIKLLYLILAIFSSTLLADDILDHYEGGLQSCEKVTGSEHQKMVLKMKLMALAIEDQSLEVSGEENFTENSLDTNISSKAKGVVNIQPKYVKRTFDGKKYLCATIKKK